MCKLNVVFFSTRISENLKRLLRLEFEFSIFNTSGNGDETVVNRHICNIRISK